MRTLRELFKGTRVAVYVLLVLTCATFLTISTARTTKAEGFLFDTTRCLVRTVLLDECRQVTPVSPVQLSPAPAPPAPSSSPQESNSGAGAASAPQPQSQLRTQPQAASNVKMQNTPTFEGLPMPEGNIEGVPADGTLSAPSEALAYPASRGDHLTFFNMYSPYAGASVQGATDEGLVSASNEGWKILGLAWYWWTILAAAGVGAFLYIKR